MKKMKSKRIMRNSRTRKQQIKEFVLSWSQNNRKVNEYRNDQHQRKNQNSLSLSSKLKKSLIMKKKKNPIKQTRGETDRELHQK